MWDQKVQTETLSLKIRKALKVNVGEQISLGEIRKWNPGMQLGSKFHQGPGKNDEHWVKFRMTWPLFVRALVEIFCAQHGVDVLHLFNDKKSDNKESCDKKAIDEEGAALWGMGT